MISSYPLARRTPGGCGAAASQAEIVKEGKDVTLIAWGNQAHRALGLCRVYSLQAQVNRMLRAAELAQEHGISCEVIDLQPGGPAMRS